MTFLASLKAYSSLRLRICIQGRIFYIYFKDTTTDSRQDRQTLDMTDLCDYLGGGVRNSKLVVKMIVAPAPHP